MSNNLYVDFHILQTVPPSCVNRDDTGSPKTAVYGGKNRARVSSQAWKRAMRLMFRDIFEEEQTGYRTKNTKRLLVEKIRQEDVSIETDDAEKLAIEILELSDIKSGGDKKDVLFFISSRQLNEIAKIAVSYNSDEDKKDKKKAAEYKEKLKAALKSSPSIDIVLFGRMAASDPNLNYDAAAQVAHAISTHMVSNEFDYFTAVDDCAPEDNAGAGHLGTVEFNSSTLYRYATVNVFELTEHLSIEEAVDAVRGFAIAFIKSMPTGKQNTFANRTVPNMVYVSVRTDQPINFANAFEKPVLANEDGYAERSERIFNEYANEVYDKWSSKPEFSWYIGNEKKLGSNTGFSEMISELENRIASLLKNAEGM